jgi:hypothetical protein
LQDTDESSLPIKVGDRVRCRAVRPGYNEARVVEGIVEYVGKRRGFGKAVFVGVNLGLPREFDGQILFKYCSNVQIFKYCSNFHIFKIKIFFK